MQVKGLSPQTDERTEDLQPTLFWKEYISSAYEGRAKLSSLKTEHKGLKVLFTLEFTGLAIDVMDERITMAHLAS